MAKVDMHCHSRYSDQPAHWVFRKIGARESYITPEDLYRTQKARGMDFVTITDHDSAEGSFQIAEKHEDAFPSCEFTVRFPDERTAVHICTYDITEEHFRMGQELSRDIYAFARYFREQDVLTAVPHPLHSYRGDLNLRHLEILVLLFEYFEEMNGLQMDAANAMQKAFLDRLSPDIIENLARKHGIEPGFDEPWKKGRLGGTDDHSSFFLGRCWTAVEGAQDYRAFLRGVRDKRSTAHGQSMRSLEFAHATQSNWVNRILDIHFEPGPFNERVSQFIAKVKPQFTDETQESGGEKVSPMIPLDETQVLIQTLIEDWRDTDLLFNRVPGHDLQEITFQVVTHLFNGLYRYALTQFVDLNRQGKIVEAFGKLSILIPGFMPAIPYVMGFRHFHSDNRFRAQVAGCYGLKNPLDEQPEKWAWFTDTLMDINGVTRTIQTYSGLAESHKIPVTTVTCLPEEPSMDGHIQNFYPIFHFALPEYESMTITMPPLLNILRHCEQVRYTRFIISTPGPLGLVAMWVASILGIPCTAIYHTDLPDYVGRLTGDKTLESVAWTLVRFFYGKMDRVYVLSETSRQKLLDHGLRHDDVRIFPKGTDVALFHPGRRDPGLWKTRGMNGSTRLLYVGRISREKDLDILCEAFKRIRRRSGEVDLVVVGDGPYLETMKKDLDGTPGVLFTGFMEGEKLAALYASADIFAFPSTTDTYGSVVLEALASGVPAVVSDKGGPREVIADGESGLVTRARDVESFTGALWRLIEDRDLRIRMGRAGRRHVAHKSWEKAFRDFWRGQKELTVQPQTR
jgi:glycosyltransferase involved in cell wall biosynthesis